MVSSWLKNDSYLGKSSGAGSLSIWTHNLKNIAFLSNFMTVGYSASAFKVGGGVTAIELYRAAEGRNITILGSIAPVRVHRAV